MSVFSLCTGLYTVSKTHHLRRHSSILTIKYLLFIEFEIDKFCWQPWSLIFCSRFCLRPSNNKGKISTRFWWWNMYPPPGHMMYTEHREHPFRLLHTQAYTVAVYRFCCINIWVLRMFNRHSGLWSISAQKYFTFYVLYMGFRSGLPICIPSLLKSLV